MIKHLLSLFLFFSILIPTTATTNLFKDNPDEFLPQMEELFKTTPDKKAVKAFIEYISAFWQNPETTAEQKELIISTCNLLSKKRARPYPDYNTYLKTVISFILHGHTGDSFLNWHKAIEDLIKNPRFQLRKVNALLKVSAGLIESNEVYSTPAVTWTSKSDNYRYEYENKELSIHFGPTSITCHAKNDSITIFDTEGVFYPLKETWMGKKGRITWERSGFDANMVYASFDAYSLQMDKSYLAVDTVEFYNRHYFDKPLMGNLEHKVMVIQNPENTLYPKFKSFEQRFKIDNIHPKINYEGGFAQNGAKFLGAGTEDNPAKITILRNDTVFLTAKSLYFALRKDQILSTDTEIKFKLDTGYLYHPGLTFKYMADLDELHLIRTGDGIAKSPYFDTFHQISMDVELIKWKLSDQWIDLKMVTGASENHAYFESLSYFREQFYNQLQGMDAIHPLQGIKDCSKYYHGKPFTAKDYARFLGLPESQVRQQIISLSFYGFIGYNVNSDEIEVRQRLYDYLLFRLGKKDYDVIRFDSHTPAQEANARLDLLNFDLNLNGVSAISICDHQNVVFFPKDEKILLKENRNFQFDGTINAGMLNMFGNGFMFNYEDFRIDMTNIDSLKMKVESGDLDYFGKPVLRDVGNTIAQLSGHLQIDEPDNKSGTRSNLHFPILVSDTESFVYFDNKNIQDGAYDRENLFFTLDPFEMDSINTLKMDNFNFAGSFESNIFPIFRENLTIRPDFSLGFKRQTPTEGYPVYGGKAQFTNTIDLSNKGLKGDGILAYVTSTSYSDDFTFLPDKVTGQAQHFTVEKQTEGIKFPDVDAKQTLVEYFPEKEELWAHSEEEKFVMYNQEAQLGGKIKVTPYGLTGAGTFYMLHADLKSPTMTFSDHSVLADSSDFHLSGTEMEGVSFSTTNLVSNIDFEMRQGTFTSKEGGSRVEFTDNKYLSFISEFSWDMDKNEIYMGARGSKGNRFVSIHRKQDSLDFYAPLAMYDVANKLIVAEEVENIKVADANIILNDGIISIRENAAMEPLDSTTIVIADSAFTHSIYDAHVSITGKYAYTGYGQHDYINGDGKTQKLTFHSIDVDKETKRSIAEGTINNNDFFTFNKHFAYKGKVKLNAAQKDLLFDGGAQMLHSCSKGPQTYIRFNASIDPQHVMIPIGDEVENYERERIYKDFFITKDSTHVYSSFLEDREDYSDIPIITSKGFLVFNNKEKTFDIASRAKHENPDTTGVLMRFADSNCHILAEGPLNMGVELDQIKLRSSGSIINERDKNKIMTSAMMGIDFFFDESAVDALYGAMINSKAKTSGLSAPTFIKRMAEWTGKQQAAKIESERKNDGEVRALPEELQDMFSFSNIDFSWNTAKRAWIAEGKADLAFVKQFAINREVEVKAEISKKRSGNSLDLYIKADDDTWFFFTYKSGMMQTLSSYGNYNSIVQELKAEDRKQKVKMGEKSFAYILAPESKLNRFLKSFSSSTPMPDDEKETDNNEETGNEKDE